MSGDYAVGKNKPPREHQFKANNQAARGRGSTKKRAPTLSQILEEVMTERHRLSNGGQVVTMSGAEIVKHQLKQMMTSQSKREFGMFLKLVAGTTPAALETAVEELKITYHRAEGSRVPLPPADLWKAKKS